MKHNPTLSRIAFCLLLSAFSLLPAAAFAQTGENSTTVDERLLGIWNLERVEITADGYTKEYSREDFNLDEYMLPANKITTLDFSRNQLTVNVGKADTEFTSGLQGSFSTDKGQLTLSIGGQAPRAFVYTIDKGLLRISFSREDMQFDLIYKK